MHGVAPRLCDQIDRPLLGRGAGGRSPGFLYDLIPAGPLVPARRLISAMDLVPANPPLPACRLVPARQLVPVLLSSQRATAAPR
jgi:hypothetical protein